MSVRAYPAYRESGVDWLGRVPSHWTVCALNYRYDVALGKMLDEKRITGDFLRPYLRNVHVQWGRIDVDDLPTMDFSGADLARYSIRSGDLLVCEGGEVGRAAIWDGRIEPCFYQKALHRLRPRMPSRDTVRFLFYVMRAAVDRGLFEASEGKATISHLTAEALRRYYFPFPPGTEQRGIAAFLARETSKIDALVTEQERLITLLKEKRQAVISQAITKGLDPNVVMKDSGVEWLGKVPAHWQVRKLNSIARLETGHTPSRQHPEYWIQEECVIPWFTLADVGFLRDDQNVEINRTEQLISPLGMANSAARLLPSGSVVLSRTASVGFSGITIIPLAVSQDFAAWICGSNLLPRYLLLCLRTMKGEFRRLMMGSTHQTIYMPDIEAFRVPLPPLEEQKVITDHIFLSVAGIDALASEAHHAITLLHERRAALISAAVTGKIDVRDHSATEQDAAA